MASDIMDRVLEVVVAARGVIATRTVEARLPDVEGVSVRSALRRLNTKSPPLIEHASRGHWRATSDGRQLVRDEITARAVTGPKPGALRETDIAGAQGLRARVWRALRIRAMTPAELLSACDDGSVPNAARRMYDYLSGLRAYGVVAFNRGAWVLVRDLGPDAPTCGYRCFDPNAGVFLERAP